MKKVLAFLTALTALFCTACDNKQDSISENSPAEDITAATSAADISENTENPEVSEFFYKLIENTPNYDELVSTFNITTSIVGGFNDKVKIFFLFM